LVAITLAPTFDETITASLFYVNALQQWTP